MATTTSASITSVSYDGSTITVLWTAATDKSVTGYQILVSSADYGRTYTSSVIAGTSASSGTLTLNGPLNTNIIFTVQVQSQTAAGAGDSSPAVPLITTLPEIKFVYYDGTDLHFRWAVAAAPGRGFRLQVVSNDSGASYTANIRDPLASSGIIPKSTLPAGGLDPNQHWLVRVIALGVNSMSALSDTSLTLPYPLTILSLKTASYMLRGSLVTTWSAPAVTWIDHYLLQVSDPESGYVRSVTVAGGVTSATLPLDPPLNESLSYQVQLRAMTRQRTGVATPTTALLVAPSVVTGAVYNGSSVTLTWMPSDNLQVTGYQGQVTSLTSGASWKATGTPNGGTINTGALPLSSACVATVTTKGSGIATTVSLRLPLLIAQATITGALYDGESVSVTWTPAADPRVTGYTVTVTPSTGTTTVLDVPGTQSAKAKVPLPAPLPDTGTSTVTVTARAGIVSSVSASVTLDTAQPAVSSIIYAGEAVNATWTPSTNTDVTGYRITLTAKSGRALSQDVLSAAAGTGTLTVGGALATDEGWRLSVATVTKSGIQAGSTPAGVVATVPRLTSVVYSGTSLDARWEAVPDPVFGLAGFILATRPANQAVTDHSVSINDALARSGTLAAAGLPAGEVAEIRAVAPSGAVTVSAAVPVLVASGALTELDFTGTTVYATWGAASGATEYAFELLDAEGGVFRRSVVTANSIELSEALIRLHAVSARVVPMNGISQGPASAAADVLTCATVITAVTYDGSKVKVTWNAPEQSTGVTNYYARLRQNGIVMSVDPTYSGLSAEFAVTLTPGCRYVVTVRPAGTLGFGPLGEMVPVVTQAPMVTAAKLTGGLLTAQWDKPVSDVVTGYHIALKRGSATVASADTENTRLALPVTLAQGGRFTLVAMARAGQSSGPVATDIPVPGQGYSYYLQPAQPTVQPYVFRSLSATQPDVPAQAFTLYVPEIFTGTPTLPITSGAFSLTAAPAGSAYPYTMSFAADNAVWTFDNNSIRPTLAAAFVTFLTNVEAVGVVQLGLTLLRNILAGGLPLTYAETLFYRYGFQPSEGYCDLVAGMTVGLDGQVYQFEGTTSSATQLSGFVPGGGRDFSVGSYFASSGTHLNGFNAFLSMLTSTTVAGNNRGSGGVIDLYATGFRRSWWRVFYPANFNGGDSIGTPSFAGNITVLGCNSWADLVSATDTYLSTGSFDTVTADIATTFFRGRMVITPQVTVMVDGERRSVPVGTTVRQIVQGLAEVPVVDGTVFAGVRLNRQTAILVNELTDSAALLPGESNPVALSAQAYATVTQQPDVFDLPLVGGDRVDFG